MNRPISREEIPSLEEYARQRDSFRERVLATKKHRQVAIGENVTLLFENRDTILYQILEMLRIENTREDEGINEELTAYNPLIPDGSNWKATMLIEFPDEAERRVQLKYLRNIEHQMWVDIGDRRITAIADEDMERSDSEKTSAVHFLRYQLDQDAIRALREGAPLRFGTSHERYSARSEPISGPTREALLGDLGELH